MTEAVFFDTLRHGLWVAVLMSTPILMVALATGIAIGLFQALTSIQEMTLTFVPKLLAIVIVTLGAAGLGLGAALGRGPARTSCGTADRLPAARCRDCPLRARAGREDGS